MPLETKQHKSQERRITKEEIKDQLEALKRAYSSGVLKVQYSDHFVIYRSLEEIRRIILSLEKELGLKNSDLKTLRVISSKGL